MLSMVNDDEKFVGERRRLPNIETLQFPNAIA
jgi:hypothetical protein